MIYRSQCNLVGNVGDRCHNTDVEYTVRKTGDMILTVTVAMQMFDAGIWRPAQLEQLLATQVDYFLANKLLSKRQFAFIKHRTTAKMTG